MFVGWDIEAKYGMGNAMKDIFIRHGFSDDGSSVGYNRSAVLEEALAAGNGTLPDTFRLLDPDPHEYTWSGITNAQQFWGWTDKVFVPAIYRGPTSPSVAYSLTGPGYLTPFARLFGAVRLRQLRSRPYPCKIFSRLSTVPSGYEPLCYKNYDLASEDRAPFGPGGKYTYSPPEVTNTFTWRSVSELILYGAGGHVVDFPQNMTEAQFLAQLSQLKADQWIDKGTRAVFVNANFYNPSVRRYHSVQLIAEFLVTGNVVTLDQKFRTFRIDYYEDSLDYFRLALEITFAAFVAGYLIVLVRELYGIWSRRQVFTYGSTPTFWHLIDIVCIILFLAGISLRVYTFRYRIRRQYLDGKLLASTAYQPIEELASLDYTFDSIMAASVALSFFKSFKFLQVNEKLSLIWTVLVRSMPHVLSFLVFFAVVFIAFVVMGYIVFGPEMREFRAFGVSLSTLGRMVFGSFNYEPMSFTQPYIAPFFFYSFMILVYFVLLNMFLAILNDTYQYIMDEHEKKMARRKKMAPRKQRDLPLAERVRDFFRSSWDRLRGRSPQSQNLREMNQILKSSKFTEEEIVQRFRKSVILRTKEQGVTLAELQEALGSDAPPNLAEMIMQNFIDAGEIFVADEKASGKMNNLLGFDGDLSGRPGDTEEIIREIESLLVDLRKAGAEYRLIPDETTTMMVGEDSYSIAMRNLGSSSDSSSDSSNSSGGGGKKSGAHAKKIKSDKSPKGKGKADDSRGGDDDDGDDDGDDVDGYEGNPTGSPASSSSSSHPRDKKKVKAEAFLRGRKK
jgi:hypothetical protein